MKLYILQELLGELMYLWYKKKISELEGNDFWEFQCLEIEDAFFEVED